MRPFSPICWTSLFSVVLAVASIGPQAWAQEAPPPAATSTAPMAAPATTPPTSVVASSSSSSATGTAGPGFTGHELVTGHWGVSWFGIQGLPIAKLDEKGAAAFDTLEAPVIGARYWLQSVIGIDAGVGFHFESNSQSRHIGDMDQSNPAGTSNKFGFLLHGGVPLAFATGKYYAFELVPEANLGFATGSIKGSPDSTSLSGWMIQAGARAGAELYFGFMGIPELALEGSVGVYFTAQQVKTSTGNASQSVSQVSLGTSVLNNPWDIFRSTIAARYYF